MQTSWLAIDETTCRNSYVNLYPGKVEVGAHYGRGMTDNAGRCTDAEFLSGRFQEVVREELGQAVLDEVIQAVRDAPHHPPFVAYYNEIARLRRYLDSIPIDLTLAQALADPSAERWHDTYLESDSVALTIDRKGSVVLKRKDTGEIVATLALWNVRGVSLRDNFFICANGKPLVIGPNGQSLQNDLAANVSGENLDFVCVYRAGERIVFRYRWADQNYPEGLLQFVVGQGMVARCEAGEFGGV